MAPNNETIDPAEALLAGRASGRGLGSQLLDIVRFFFRPGKMSPQEYFYYGLYDDQLYTDEERFRFISDDFAASAILSTARFDWFAVGKDKILNYALMKAQGLPIPNIVAVVDPIRVFPGAQSVRSVDELVTFLRSAPYPLFAKPATGAQSFGNAWLEAYDPENDSIQFRQEGSRDVTEYANWVWQLEGMTGGDGFMFQEILQPDPTIAEWVGERLTSVRVVVMIEDNVPRVTHAVWKILTGDNFADNYWRGNLAGQVDLETGELLRMVRGGGLNLEVLRKHPDTRVELIGKRVPHWDQIKSIALEGARLMPKVRLQGWDIGLTDQGPLVIETNLGTGFSLIQLSSGQGFMTPEFKEFMARSKRELDAELKAGQMG